MNWYPWFWKAWLILGGIVEIIALIRPETHDTLSEQIWALRDSPKGMGFFSLAIAIMGWAIYHFIYEGKR